MRNVTRRKTILGAMGVGTAALAGCVSDSTNDDPSPGDDNDDTDEEETNDNSDDGNGTEDGIESSSIAFVGSSCAGPDPGTAFVDVTDDGFVIGGTLPSGNPCYRPTLVDVAVEDGTLALTVDVVREEDDEGEPTECIECAGKVTYDATVELAADTAVDEVQVTHETGETHTIPEDEFGDGRPELLDSSIETTRADARGEEDSDGTDVDVGDEQVTVTGTILTSTPHFEAVLEAAEVRQRELAIQVDVASTLDEDEAGTQVTGVIEYEATFEMENVDALEAVHVRHPDGSHAHGWDEASESAGGEEITGEEGA